MNFIAKAWPKLSKKAIEEQWQPEVFLAELCEIEASHRYENKLKRLLKDSQLPIGKQLSQYDFNEASGALSTANKTKNVEVS